MPLYVCGCVCLCMHVGQGRGVMYVYVTVRVTVRVCTCGLCELCVCAHAFVGLEYELFFCVFVHTCGLVGGTSVCMCVCLCVIQNEEGGEE